MMTIYYFIWYFIIYSCLGWCIEVAYHTLTHGEFANRGFLNGPVCPIYGFGAAAVIATLTPFKENYILLFVAATLITSIIEYATGYVLEKVFHSKWWDYSDVPFNIHGYICLKFSICWGIVCVFLMRVIEPGIEHIINAIPLTVGIIFVSVLTSCYIADATITVIALRSLSIKLRTLEDIVKRFRKLSDEVGLHISDGVEGIMEFTKEKEEIGQEKLRELELLRNRYKEKLAEKHFGHRRLLRAFPHVRTLNHKFTLESLKKYIKNNK